MLTKMKKRTALLASVAVLCATVALVPQAANATASKVPNAGTSTDAHEAPQSLTALSACPGSSAPAAGFTDTTSTDVDCIKMFGITQGTTATTYGPDESIPRWQMALFIHRMFTPTSMAAAGLTAVPAFTDIGDLSADIQAAINALASHSITLGKTATTFAPNDNVTRAEMALFLYRFAQIVGAYDDATPSGLTMNIASGQFNYTDIAGQSFEAMESIIGLYNAGVIAEAGCTAAVAAVSGCATSYRPSDNMTRAEMASMIKELLDHTNARPAGATIQPTSASGLAGTIASSISYRNADFTPKVSGLVDEFYQVRNDSTAATAAASVPFNALSGLCNSSTGGVGTGGGTLCVMTAGDKATNAKGNVAGASQVLTASTTGRWWVWTGENGSQYIDGTTSTVFNYDNAVPATAAALSYAATAKPTWSSPTAFKCDASGEALVTNAANDGICTRPGAGRTITVALASGTAASVVDGYTVRFQHKKVDYLGNITNSTTYVAGGSTNPTYTITCGADNSATVNGAIGGSSSYWESHEVTVDFHTAAAGTGRPALDLADPTISYPDTVGKANNTMNLTCDDATRAYVASGGTATVSTLAIDDNTRTVSAAGQLASITATAYDQYGDGVAGKTVRFDSDTTGATGAAGGAQNRATLTTGADGSATLTAIVCQAQGKVEWSTNTTAVDFAAIAATAPGANAATEGTTIHCASAGTDGAYGALAAGTQTTTITFNDTQANMTGGNVQITIKNWATPSFTINPGHAGLVTQNNGTAAAGTVNKLIDDETSMPANVDVVSAVANAKQVITIVFAANTGTWDVTIGTDTLAGGAVAAADPIVASTGGAVGTTFVVVDDEPTSNEITVLETKKGNNAANGASLDYRTYMTFTHDDTDAFSVTSATPANVINGATQAQFETALGAHAGTGALALSYRTGALTTGVSAFEFNVD
jgi:hypothetical protein